MGPFLRADEELGRSEELVDLFETKILNFTRIIFQVKDDGAYPIGLNDTPNEIDFYIILFS